MKKKLDHTYGFSVYVCALFPLIHLHFVKLFVQNVNKILRKVVKTFKKNMREKY